MPSSTISIPSVALCALLLGCASQVGDSDVMSDGTDSGPSVEVGSDCDADRASMINARLRTAPPQSLSVSANQYWANSGIYVRAGDSLEVAATGMWSHIPGDMKTAAGFPDLPAKGCPYASLVASVGLRVSDQNAPVCVGTSSTLVAPRDGILYFAMNDSGPVDNSGSLEVSVVGGTKPSSLPAEDLPCADWNDITIADVEVVSASKKVSFVLPVDLIREHAMALSTAFLVYDDLYQAGASFAGGSRYGGQPIRYGIDDSFMPRTQLLGNPYLLSPDLMAGGELHVAFPMDPQYKSGNWFFVFGELFADANGFRYGVGAGSRKAWSDLVSYFLRARADYPSTLLLDNCSGQDAHKATGTYQAFRDSSSLQFCMLLELHEKHGGWTFYSDFLKWYNQQTQFPTFADDAAQWRWIRDSMNRFATGDVSAVMQSYKVPL